MRWVKWNSASRFSWIVTFSRPAGAEKRCSSKDTCQSLHLNFAKALHSVGPETIFFTTWLCCEKGIGWFSAFLGYRGRHQGPAEEYHTWNSCAWSAPNTTPRVWACSAAISDWEPRLASLDFEQGQNHHGLSPGTKAPSTARDAEPRPAWWPQAVLPHHSLSGGSSSSSFCSPNTPSLTDAWWGPFPTIFLSLWTLLSPRTAPLQPGFETLLKQLSQLCFAILRVKKMVRGKRFSRLCCMSTCG